MLRSGGWAELSLNMVLHPTTLVYNALISFLGFLHYTSGDPFEHLGRATSEWLSRGKHFISRRTVFDQIQLKILI